MGVSESRISQLLTQILRDQKKRIQAGDSSGAERERQRVESEKIPREIQAGPDVQSEAVRELERVQSSEGKRVGEGAAQEISNQEESGYFRVESF